MSPTVLLLIMVTCPPRHLLTHGVSVRIAIVSESFYPDVNGVAHSTLRIAEQLVARGHEPLVVAPRPAPGQAGDGGPFPFPVARVASMPVPGYSGFRVGMC